MAQRTGLPLPLRWRQHGNRAAAACGQLPESVVGPVSRLEDFLAAARLPQKDHRHRVGTAEENIDGLQLLGGKAGEAVEIEILAVGVVRLGQLGDELVHIVGEIHPVPA